MNSRIFLAIPVALLLLAGCQGNSATGPEPINMADYTGLVLTDSATDEGQAAYKIETKTATYYFQKDAGGFSSLLDRDGNDWISFNDAPGPAGLYRGIPNLVNAAGLFHPGFAKCRSRIVSQTDSTVIISSEDTAGTFLCEWLIGSYSATLTVARASSAFWFLYEGTPGGSFEKDGDYWMTSDGSRRKCDITIYKDLPGQEWICFGQPGLKRLLFLAHHENDTEPDYYSPNGNAMTILGFGRNSSQMYLTSVPQHFTFGFFEDTLYSRIGLWVPRVMADATQLALKAVLPGGQLTREVLSDISEYSLHLALGCKRQTMAIYTTAQDYSRKLAKQVAAFLGL